MFYSNLLFTHSLILLNFFQIVTFSSLSFSYVFIVFQLFCTQNLWFHFHISLFSLLQVPHSLNLLDHLIPAICSNLSWLSLKYSYSPSSLILKPLDLKSCICSDIHLQTIAVFQQGHVFLFCFFKCIACSLDTYKYQHNIYDAYCCWCQSIGLKKYILTFGFANAADANPNSSRHWHIYIT